MRKARAGPVFLRAGLRYSVTYSTVRVAGALKAAVSPFQRLSRQDWLRIYDSVSTVSFATLLSVVPAALETTQRN